MRGSLFRGSMLAALALFVLAAPARAECPHDGKVIPVARGAVEVDGRLDDATWATAQPDPSSASDPSGCT